MDKGFDTNSDRSRLSVFGLGKLGSPMAAIFAAKGFATIGCDLNPAPVAALAAGRAPVQEPGLQQTIDVGRSRLRATQDTAEAVRDKADYHVVVVTSTVMPGSTGGEIRAALEQTSGRAVGQNVGLCYHPE